MFRTLCFEFRIVTIEYFLNDLTLYEASDIVKNLEFVDRNDRELKRYELYVAIQSNSKNKIALKDVFSLPWDNMRIDEDEGIMNDEQIKEMDMKASSMADLLNSGKMKMEAARF